jgi:hypothetical protein
MKTTLMPPDFIIIGAMRAGTTALADLLSRHPEIGMSRLKETDYFIAEKNFSRGPVWYQSLFPMDRPIRGEASPNYAKSDVFAGVPQRIHAARPDVRLIYIVRDPVERFWSQYNHTFLMGGAAPPADRLLDCHEGRHILASSMYARQLNAFLGVFPAAQISVIDLADLSQPESGTLETVLKFIGADPNVSLEALRTANSSGSLAQTPGWALKLSQHKALTGFRAAISPEVKTKVRSFLGTLQKAPRETPPIPADAKQRVADALAEDATAFRKLVGRPFSHWSV